MNKSFYIIGGVVIVVIVALLIIYFFVIKKDPYFVNYAVYSSPYDPDMCYLSGGMSGCSISGSYSPSYEYPYYYPRVRRHGWRHRRRPYYV